MYKILSVNPSGLFSYGLHKTINVHKQGSVLLEGVNLDRGGNSNGAGKTSFFYAICHILYGKNPSGEGADKVVNEFLGKYFGQVLFLDKNNQKWRVTDVRKWRKSDKYPDEKLLDSYIEEPSEIHASGLRLSGTDVYLEKWDESSRLWIDERSSNRSTGDTRLDLKATRKKIVDILNIDYDQFMSIAYLAQQRTLKFIEGTHKEKLQVLAELSDLKAWDKRIQSIREDLSQLDSERDRLHSKLDGLGQITLNKPNDQDKILIQSSIDSINLQINKIDIQLAELTRKQTNWTLGMDKLNARRAATMKSIRENSTISQAIQLQIYSLSNSYYKDCEAIRSSPKPFEISKLETEISELNGQIAIRRFDLEQLMVGAGRCNRCRTNVSIEHILRHRELISLEITDINEKIQSNKNDLERIISAWEVDVSQRLTSRSEQYNLENNALNSKIEDLNMLLFELHRVLDDVAECESNLGTRPDSTKAATEQLRMSLLTRLSSCEAELKSWDGALKQFNEYQSLISTAKAKISSIDYDIKHLKVLEKLFGDKGIKAYKLDNVLSILNQSLDKYINIITDGSVKIWISQYREKTDGELATDLQILVREGHKHEVPFALYSGGERQQITLAFIGAFWQLASKCGAGVNIMCLDEIFGPLDEYNTNNVFNYLDHMRTSGKDSIFIVTHNEHIKHQVKFDQVWTITKKDHMSTLKVQ